MIVRVMLLFLIGMAILAMFGKLRMPKRGAAARKCKRCGRPFLGKSTQCECKDKRG
jgi:hypothetical protein